jgi:HD-GYP domain-containing protein (c-di-GMP phosphodiesterase class II)
MKNEHGTEEHLVHQLKSLQERIAELEASEAELKLTQDTLRQKLHIALEGTINALVSIVVLRDPLTASHQVVVTNLACAIATEMGVPEERIEGLRVAGAIYDLGMISVPTDILTRAGPLTETEFQLVKIHPETAYHILKTVELPWPVAQIALQHHERWDGSGYPQGLLGEDIILEARILAVADVVEAIGSHRHHRPPHGIDSALGEISRNRGILYDPDVVDACLHLFTEKGLKLQ